MTGLDARGRCISSPICEKSDVAQGANTGICQLLLGVESSEQDWRAVHS